MGLCTDFHKQRRLLVARKSPLKAKAAGTGTGNADIAAILEEAAAAPSLLGCTASLLDSLLDYLLLCTAALLRCTAALLNSA